MYVLGSAASGEAACCAKVRGLPASIKQLVRDDASLGVIAEEADAKLPRFLSRHCLR